jgi:succinate dehydrogenase hydrophobic anchor subunit
VELSIPSEGMNPSHVGVEHTDEDQKKRWWIYIVAGLILVCLYAGPLGYFPFADISAYVSIAAVFIIFFIIDVVFSVVVHGIKRTE